VAGKNSRNRRGLTLLEVMLAIALSAAVLVLIGTSVRLYLKITDIRHTTIEQSQLARTLLKMIANDLRSTVAGYEINFSDVEDMASMTSIDGLEDLEGLEGMEGVDTDAIDDAVDETDFSSLADLPPRPGLYGNRYQLLFDVARLPRPDEYLAEIEANGGVVASDVRTVSYYIGRPSEIGADISTELGQATRAEDEIGLMRRSLDRAATMWALENGDSGSLDQRAQLLAPEVTQIAFRYFDGETWQAEWDTAENGGVPLSVGIAIAIADEDADEARRDQSPASSVDRVETREGETIYRLTVSLPTAVPLPSDGVDTGEELP
jgi:prepilin-type N-terminal cleavage/methylation domain-containing protein